MLLACTAGTASATEYTGTLNGSNYFVVVPDSGWNGTLVVLAHGYRDLADHAGDVDDTTPGSEGYALGLAANGYAVATTSYRANGWAVEEALDDLVDIARYTRTRILATKPDRTLLAGFSMGGLATMALAEHGPFNGHLAMCAPGAGAPRHWDWAAANLLAFDVALDDPATPETDGLPDTWGTVADGNDNIDNVNDGVGATVGAWLSDFSNYPKFEFARLVSSQSWTPTYYTTGIFANFTSFTEFRGELERRAGGPVVQNVNHTYSLTDVQKGYLVGIGLTELQIDEWLAEMNATEYAPPRFARQYLRRYAKPNGRLRAPMLTMHTMIDTVVPVHHESKYAETVAAAGRSSLLQQWFTDEDDHCLFTADQILSAVNALDDWVETGVAPAGPPLYVSGFLSGFVPPPWPQP